MAKQRIPRRKRIVLKLSGEGLGGKKGKDLKIKVLKRIAKEVRQLTEADVEVAIVVGGGNFWRGAQGSHKGMDRAQADYMGMLATLMNALALQDALEHEKCETRVMSALRVDPVAEPYIRRRAIRHLEKGRVVIFACGIGNPYFSTDTTLVQRAIELNADAAYAAKNGTEGVYDKDPNQHKDAKLLKTVSIRRALHKGLGVMDATAFAQAGENGLAIVVFNSNEKGELWRALNGKAGTLVHP